MGMDAQCEFGCGLSPGAKLVDSAPRKLDCSTRFHLSRAHLVLIFVKAVFIADAAFGTDMKGRSFVEPGLET